MNIEEIKKLDLQNLNESELWYLKHYTLGIYSSLLPYTTKNNVTFSEDIISIRTNNGFVRIDNGYYGSTADKRDYYALLQYLPLYTSECKFMPSIEISSITTAGFETLSKLIEKADKNYGKLYNKKLLRFYK